MSDDLQKMYKDALKAMKAGETEKARNLLSEVVEEDEENIDAWVALSKVVDNDAEKRICLTTILQLDPTNSYARKELAKSDEKIEQGKDEEEFVPGITRKMVRNATIGSAVYIVVVFTITVLLLSAINGGKQAQRVELTKIAVNATGTVSAFNANATTVAETQIQVAISATEYAQSLITPSPTMTNTPDPAFATWTPTATEFVANYRAEGVERVPASLPGRIYGWGGRDSSDQGYLEVFTILANGTEAKREIINEDGRNLASDVPGQTVLFERYNRRFEEGAMVTLQMSDPENSITGYGDLWTDAIINVENPSVSADGSRLVVDAEIRLTGIREIFLLDVNALTLTQLTDDAANYRTPAITQDGTRVLAVREDPTNGSDLVLIDPITRDQIVMTNDGNAIVESHPFWHPDNQQAIFRGHPDGQPNNGEIYTLRVLPESGATSLLIATLDDESDPVFDPTGAFIAFASNRAGNVYNIYVFDVASKATYQLTEFEHNHFPGGWSLN